MKPNIRLQSLLAITLGILWIPSNAQESKWAAGIQLSGNVYQFERTIPPESTRSYPLYVISTYGCGTGINLNQKMGKHFGLQYGIVYSPVFTKLFADYSQVDWSIFRYIVAPKGPRPLVLTVWSTSHYIELPVKVNYLIGNKKFRGILGAGVSGHLYVGGSKEYEGTYVDGSYGKGYEYDSPTWERMTNSIRFTAGLTAGAQYDITKKIFVRLEPGIHLGSGYLSRNSLFYSLNLSAYRRF